MKKCLGTFVLFAALLTYANAQPLKSFGIKAGGVMATQNWTGSTSRQFSTEYHLAPAAGIFVEGFKVGNASMLAELWYLHKGFTTTIDSSSTNKKETLHPKFIYFSVPFIFKYRFGDEELSLYLLGGPRIDYLFHINPERVPLIAESFSEGDSDLGVVLGLGTQFNIGFLRNIIAEVRYTPSIIDAVRSDSLTIRNNSFEFVMGIGF